MAAIGHSTVAILSSQDDTPWGTGFLVGPRHILTCAHVVGDALGDRNNECVAKLDVPPSQDLRVRFTVADRPTTLGAKVVHWNRYYERHELTGETAADCFVKRDLALLELNGEPPLLARPVRFWSPADATSWGTLFKDRPLIAAGFPKIGLDAFHSLVFTYDSLTDGHEIMVRQMAGDYDQDDLSGLSGAGLVLEDCGLVIGLVMEVGTDRNLVVAKPARHLQEFWSEIRLITHGSELRDEKKIPDQLLLDIDREPQRHILSEATMAITASGPGIMLAAIPGSAGNRVSEWINFLVAERIQYTLEVGLSDWVQPIRPISVYRKRGLGSEELFRIAMNDVAKRLGLKFGADFINHVRAALNEDDADGLSKKEPPPYWIFQFSVHNFGEAEIQVLDRLIRFWDSVGQEELERSHLVFFIFLTKETENIGSEQDLFKICQSLRDSFATTCNIQVIDPVPGVRKLDTFDWIDIYENALDDFWHLDKLTAEQYRKVIKDIFVYEADRDELPLRHFQSELEKLELCQKFQEG